MDSLRSDDVDIYTEASQSEICVRASTTKGMSCWDSVAHMVALHGKTWRLPVNSPYDETCLLLWEDYPGSRHWNWSPARDMPGSEYIAALRDVNARFI